MVPKAIMKQLKLPRLGQIGYVVKDVDKKPCRITRIRSAYDRGCCWMRDPT